MASNGNGEVHVKGPGNYLGSCRTVFYVKRLFFFVFPPD